MARMFLINFADWPPPERASSLPYNPTLSKDDLWPPESSQTEEDEPGVRTHLASIKNTGTQIMRRTSHSAHLASPSFYLQAGEHPALGQSLDINTHRRGGGGGGGGEWAELRLRDLASQSVRCVTAPGLEASLRTSLLLTWVEYRVLHLSQVGRLLRGLDVQFAVQCDPASLNRLRLLFLHWLHVDLE